ncbi:MAG: threonylcarbamoyl-AMP synthase [Spirochaetales bacterium]|nr:threonylcarbamoyl-AMP synthase [Spirochaetales bacterium]
MIEYVSRFNINDRVLEKAKTILEEGGVVAYPTDTSWSIGASVLSVKGIEKLRRLKGDFSKKFPITMICSKISQIAEVAQLSTQNFKIITRLVPGPYVFILPALKKIEKKVNMKRLEIGIRIPDHPVPVKIIETLENPIFSITASKNMLHNGWWDTSFAEENLFECGYELENIEGIDLILDTGEDLPKVLSTVLRMSEDEISVVRKGIGEI